MSWLVARERWLPAAGGLAWWITFYPGFISDDSLITLTEAQSGAMSVWFTAWWIYLADALSLGTRAVPLLTLIGVLTLEYAIYAWLVAVFPRGRARAVTAGVMAIVPMVGALGVQVRHDAFMTAGLLLVAAVVTRARRDDYRWRPVDLATLAAAALLVPTRHNGVPTIAAAVVVLWLLGVRRWRPALALLAVAAGATVVTYAATRASGHRSAVEPAQTVEWLMGDISCVLSKEGVDATEAEWATLTRVAARADWPQPHACVAMNPMLRSATFNSIGVVVHRSELIDVWQSLTARYPGKMIAAHATRVRLFLPPLATGMPDSWVINFLHSTILPNDFGLAWIFPAMAERARLVVRAWNAMGYLIANSALWLIVLTLAAWRAPEYRSALMPALAIGITLNLGLLAAAPISEGRYGLFILICGQATTMFLALRRTE